MAITPEDPRGHAVLTGGAAPAAGGGPVVALVGSAGGLDAVSHVLSGLPAGFPASVIVLIHQSPTHASHLVDVLRRRTALPTDEARDGTPLVPGTVVVVPPGRHVLVLPQRRICIIVSGTFPPNRPSADLLLATLATAVRSSAIAVVLSGGGNDGATGASAVHTLGGTVIASDEASSQQYSMPLAAIERDQTVDHVLDLDRIAPALTELVGNPRASSRPDPVR